ncbi:hypothetical protein KSP39_PZI007762 [Platanthera zijinensis]|uniref:Endonuclease/exonuclease/phosphatase domain-containing protein n=1 Tax=Platanthera zijinensis TaxID=2320716 RepID=A0AAP0BQT8_9ASPA
MSVVIIWNCRGVRKKEAGNYLRSIVHAHDVGVVGVIGLLETKVELLSRRDIDAVAGRNWDFFHHPAEGRSGGILVLWRSDIVQVTISSAMAQCVLATVRWPDRSQWMVAFVYANKYYHIRRSLWQLLAKKNGTPLPMLIGGDFNCLLRAEDKSSPSNFHYTIGAREMDEWITSSALHELQFSGPAFTWCNNRPGPDRLLSRLDRMFFNATALDRVNLATVQHLNRVASDHCPLLLRIAVDAPPPKSRWLRFEDVWLSYPTAWRVVTANWSKADHGAPAEVLSCKCRRTLRVLHFWSRHKFRELGTSRTSLEAEIARLQVLESTALGLSPEQCTMLISQGQGAE